MDEETKAIILGTRVPESLILHLICLPPNDEYSQVE